MKGIHWLLIGIGLLVVMFVGVQWLRSPTNIPDGRTKNGSTGGSDKPPDKIVAWGFFENENGVANLAPKQYGDIVELISEHTTVKKGAVLLQLDDTMARFKVKEAEADVRAGQQQVAEANHLIEIYDLQKKQQKSAVNAVSNEIKAKELERDIKVKTWSENDQNKKNMIAMYEFALDQLNEKKKAEEHKYKQIELQDAKLKIQQAKADLDAKQSRLDQAKESLKYYQIIADRPGKVLRTFVHKGEMLGPTPRMTAVLEFMPEGKMIVRAEVLQEWGRFVKPDQEVIVKDDVYNGVSWTGKVRSVSEWYAPTRSPVIEPFRMNDVRTLEVLIDVKDADKAKHNQRVRAEIKIN